jgi:hypothetical protein
VTSQPFDAYDDTALLLHSAVAGDAEAVAGLFADVFGREDVGHAYKVAVCLAATMIGDQLPGGGAALEFPDIDEASYDARWVARFVSAYANADAPTGEALFGAAVADGQLPACMMTLTGTTLATLQHRTSI